MAEILFLLWIMKKMVSGHNVYVIAKKHVDTYYSLLFIKRNFIHIISK